MQIGLPKSLLYYYYYPFWKKFFDLLDVELVLSEATSTDLLNHGVKESISEICVPMKVYIGQVLNLIEKGVDKVYIPRFISIRKGVTFCPKFLGLPDMIKHSLPGMEDKILTHHIESGDDDISAYENYTIFKDAFNKTDNKIKFALETAKQEWLEFRKLQREGYKTEELLNGNKVKMTDGSLNIGLLGYVYNMYDKFINMDLINRLEEMGVSVTTFEMVDQQVTEEFLNDLEKPLFWEFTNKLMAVGYHFMDSDDIDGIIHITAFGCGPDSILGPFLEIDADQANKPFMTLRIDEQTGESHLLTRLEAFIDLLKLNKRREII
ncbi:MAG: acyl-CoA dehydratase activase-related protein [Halanaerobiales bacterium]